LEDFSLLGGSGTEDRVVFLLESSYCFLKNR
jgi:hypothetical protein